MADPRYRRVAAELRREILDGKRRPGDQLPTYPELAKLLGISITTARNAVLELVRENLVYTATSKGTIVRDRRILDYNATDPLRADRPTAGSDVWIETGQKAGRTASKSFEMHIEPAGQDVARWLGVPVESWVVMRRLVQYLDGEPWSYEVSYYPRDLAEATGIDSPHDIEEGTTRRLRDTGYGETAWTDSITSRLAGPDEAETLAVPVGTQIYDVVRIGATAEQVTRVTRTRRVADRNRLVYEVGADAALDVIRNVRASEKEGEL